MSRTELLRSLYTYRALCPLSTIYHITITPKVHGTSRKELYRMLEKYVHTEGGCQYIAVVNETAPDTDMEHFHGFMGFGHKQDREHFSNDDLTVLYRFGGTKGWAKYCTKGKRKITCYRIKPKIKCVVKYLD